MTDDLWLELRQKSEQLQASIRPFGALARSTRKPSEITKSCFGRNV